VTPLAYTHFIIQMAKVLLTTCYQVAYCILILNIYFCISPPNELSDHCLLSTGIKLSTRNTNVNSDKYNICAKSYLLFGHRTVEKDI
jgi:hypothetical protein